MEKIYSIAVIGGGSAGTMAVLRSVLNNDETLFFPGSGKEKKRSRGFWVSKVENMPGHLEYKKGIENPALETFKWLADGEFKEKFHWQKNRSVTKIAKNTDGLFEISDNKDEKYWAKFVVLCTGIMDVQPLIGGSIEPILPYANMQTVDYCLRCDGHHTFNKKTAVIGHTSAAAWVAIMLKERYENPSMSVITHTRAPEFGQDVIELMKLHNIEVIEDEIVSVLGDQKLGRLDGFQLKNRGEIQVEFCFVGLGMLVYNELAVSLGAKIDERGFVLTDAKGMSEVENLYVAGDLRAGFKKQIYTAWDMAVDSLDDINQKIRAEKRARLKESR